MRDLPSAESLPKGCLVQGWTRLNPGAWSFFWVSHVDDSGSVTTVFPLIVGLFELVTPLVQDFLWHLQKLQCTGLKTLLYITCIFMILANYLKW